MKSKKMLALILTFCLMFGILAPAASAIQVAGENVKNVIQGENATTGSNWLDKLLISAGEALGLKNTLRGQKPDSDYELNLVNGKWVATTADGSMVELQNSQLPTHIQELKKAAEEYQPMDKVVAFVTLKTAPSADSYSSIHDVPASLTEKLTAEQNELIAAIEQNVLDGQKLNIVSRFTHLTNSVVIEVEFGKLEAVAALKGVKSVFLNPTYAAAEVEDTVYPATESAGVMTGVANVWQELGYTGAGMTIAILDTGLDTDHPSFAADPADPLWNVQWLQEMLDTYDLRAEALFANGTLTAEDLYYNAKIPFTFDYARGITNVTHNDGIGDHGTHVAGIAAANKMDSTNVVGMAPDAQLLGMKVFSPGGGASLFTVIEALQDCMILGVDVANLSLGTASGFTTSSSEEIEAVFQRISESDLVVDIAAGNEGTSSADSNWGYGMQLTDHIENGTMASPATYANAVAIGSADNNLIATDCIELADGTKIAYMYSIEYIYMEINYTLYSLINSGVMGYYVVDGLGYEEEFYDENGNSLVNGKIAVIPRGEISFNEKIMNAENAGAIGAIIWNTDDSDIFTFGMTTADTEGNIPAIPVGLITHSDGQKMADAETKTLIIPKDYLFRVDPYGGQMSSFSCWGTTSDLRLMPDMTGIGGSVYSTIDGGDYGTMSGTSMACPQVAGVTALVLQYLEEEFPNATKEETRVLIDSLLMSTAVTIIDLDSGVEASPRQQGAGLVDAMAAITAKAYLTVEGSARPKAELKDSTTGEYSFTFFVHNYSDAEKTYTLRASLLAEDVLEQYGMYFLAEQDRALDNSAVTFSRDTVTVAAGGSEEVTVTIKLTDADKEWIDTYFPNGNYVEGFVYLEGEGEATLSLPFMGFYGRWDEAPLFDEGFWYSDGLWLEEYYIDGNQYHHYLFTSLGATGYDWVLGMNAYTGPQYIYDEYGNPHVYYNPNNNIISPNGDGAVDEITDMYLSLMRNAKELEMTYTDAEGNVLDYRLFTHESKTMYYSSYGQVVPFIYSWTYRDVYDFSGLEDGDVVYLTIDGVIDYEGAERDILLDKMPIYIDTTAPVLDTTNIVETTSEEGNFITLTITDAHPAAVITMNNSGSQIYAYYSDLDMVDNGDGTYSVTIDVTGLGDKIRVAICDYGCNESYYDLSYTLVDNNPVMDKEALYAYQVYHEYFLYYYGWDAMFGWSTIDKVTGEPTMISSDQYEYWALAAAEYVDGLVFGVDAGGNLLYMTPGLWNRNIIANIGLNVIDMAFDEVTGTMYLATSDKENYSYCLYTVDLLTGDTTLLHDYHSQYDVPWAMTFIDGTLYCTKYYYGSLYTVDLNSSNCKLNPVKDADGNAITIKDSAGNATHPYYAQSMTYSKADGVIYWAYYDGDSCDFITINPTDWTNTATAFYWDQEFVGLITLEDYDYQLPESTEISKVVISDEQIILGTGKTQTLTASALPWNAPDELRQLTWTSSNEAVATVTNYGMVVAHTEGEAIITASCNGFEASCKVNVVNISGNMNAYKYYDGEGNMGLWLDIDLAECDETAVAYSPVDFIAAEYNGHTGLVYGYDEVGQCYWFDPETGNYDKLGNADSTMIPGDMAYDYSTGNMYVLVSNQNFWQSTIYTLNMATGKLVKVASTYDYYITLACSTEGQLFTISYDGILYELHLMESEGGEGGEGGGGGVMPLASGGRTSYTVYANYVMDTGVHENFYVQTMCYDHNNDVLLWLNTESSCLYWIGDLYDMNPYIVPLGDPSGTGLIQYTGAYVVPETIEPLPYVPVETVEADDVLVLAGATALPSVNIYPANATCGYVSEWYSVNPDVAYVDEKDNIVGVSVGTTTIYATVIDTDEAGNETWYDVAFDVVVKNGTDNIYGYLIGDLGNSDGYYFAELDDATTEYTGVSYVIYNGTYMVLYAAEHVDGKIYAYGFDPNDWNANFHFLTIDARSWSVLDAINMGDGFPFVYDMAFDYTTGTMYAAAGPNDSATDLYYVNMANGELIACMEIEPMIMSLTVDANGTIYGMAASEETFNPQTWESTFETAKLYVLDPENGTYEVYMDTGFNCNMLASMAYDFDTGYIYWTGLFRGMSYESGLYMIDLDEKAAYNLGPIGAVGSQVTGLMIFAESYPEQPDTLTNLAITTPLVELSAGNSQTLEVFAQPYGLDVELTWESADLSVASVDQNGVVTGVSAGQTTITVTAFDGVTAKTSQCTVIVYGPADYFISYDKTNAGFVTISRPDSVTTLYPDAEGTSEVTAMVFNENMVYGYDKDNNLFVTSLKDGFERTYIGNANIEVTESYHETIPGYYTYENYYEYYFTVRDMTWDPVNNRLLALGVYGLNKHVTVTSTGYNYSYVDTLELQGGCRIYEVDLETGELIELFTVYSEYGDPYSGVAAMTMTDNGQMYIYSSYMDYISLLDMETGLATDITTFQNMGVYGDSNGASMAMEYDATTNAIYMLFTQNGKFYFLYKFDITSTALTEVGKLNNIQGAFAGLTLNVHVCTGDPSVDTLVWETEDEYAKYQCECGKTYVLHQGYPCSSTVISAPTCTRDGYTVHYCKVCDLFHYEITPALGHSYEVTDSLDATCEDEGYITYTCTVCDHTYTDVIPATGHSYEAVVTAPTCENEGYTTYTCSACGDSYVADYVDALGHEMGEWYVATEATCTENGVEQRDCANCDYCETREIAAFGHSYEGVVTEPTCVEAGYTTYTCANCGDSYVADYVDALGHTYEAVVTAPTCTEGGYTTYTCADCGESYIADEVAALGHSYEVTDSKEATADEDGYTTYTCSGCGDTYTEVIPAIGTNPGTGNSAIFAVAGLMVTAIMGGAILVFKRKELLNA